MVRLYFLWSYSIHNDSNFFLPGSDADVRYINVRDKELWRNARVFIELLWQTYRPYADRHFRSDAKDHFLQRFWEMYVACTLLHRGFKLERFGNEGPDFYFLLEGRRIWVEAIAPGSGNGPDGVLAETKLEPGIAYRIPSDQILLRYTNALDEKYRKYIEALNKGIVKPEEQMILAINSRGIPHAPYSSDIPYIVQAYLGFGELAYAFNRETEEEYLYHGSRENVRKLNGVAISTTSFLETKFSAFSAVLHSGVDWANRPAKLGDDFLILHNPSAAYKLPTGIFSWCRQLLYNEGSLEELPSQPIQV